MALDTPSITLMFLTSNFWYWTSTRFSSTRLTDKQIDGRCWHSASPEKHMMLGVPCRIRQCYALISIVLTVRIENHHYLHFFCWHVFITISITIQPLRQWKLVKIVSLFKMVHSNRVTVSGMPPVPASCSQEHGQAWWWCICYLH